MTFPVIIIAEAGVNHNGDSDLAFQLIDVAVDAGVDVVKFQTFKADALVSRAAPKAEYQKKIIRRNESQLAMLKRLELPYELHYELIAYCEEKGIQFLSTAFDSNSLDFLVNDLQLKTLKIPSGEITNGPFLLAHAQTGCDLIVSTGMATQDEIKNALEVIAFGLINNSSLLIRPSIADFKNAYHSEYGQQLLQEKVTLLHCTTEYPAPPEDINLNAMLTMRDAFGLKVGYSDHSAGIIIPIGATTLGARVIEKHFTLDKALIGPDHKASLNPHELKSMVMAVRTMEQAMGNGVKECQVSEKKNRDVVRKSLLAGCDISKGDLFTVENIAIKRPGDGVSPMKFWEVLGQLSDKDYKKDEPINE